MIDKFFIVISLICSSISNLIQSRYLCLPRDGLRDLCSAQGFKQKKELCKFICYSLCDGQQIRMQRLSAPTRYFETKDYLIGQVTNFIDGRPGSYCLLQFQETNHKHLQQKILNVVNNFELQREIKCPQIVVSYSLMLGHSGPTIMQESYDHALQNVPTKDFSYSDKLSIIQDLAEGVKFLHERRLVNVGLSPSKVAIFRGKQCCRGKIIFLDSVQQLGEQEKQATIPDANITNFSAPQIRLTRKCNNTSDIWSLGYLFYFLLFGNQKGVKVWGNEVVINYPEGTPSWMQEILSRMLAYEPSQRYTIAEFINRMKFMKQCASVAGRFMPTFME